MLVILAEAMGMCFGVRDALSVMRAVPAPETVTINGELVHNPVVVDELRARGFRGASAETPRTSTVLITAHGVSDAERRRLEEAGKTLIDTTCPLVRHAHAAALRLQEAGYFVIVIGKAKHVEVRGLTGDLADFAVVESINDVRTWPHAKLGIIAQTTAIEADTHVVVDRIRALNPHAAIEFTNTICQPTRDRQAALTRVLTQITVLVVVGGRASNNTLHLVQRAERSGVRTIHVEDDADLHPNDFFPPDIVGLTAGTSTLPETIDAVHRRLLTFHA